MIPPTAAVILAGGRATRMGGGDKCRILVDGQAVVARIIRAIGPGAAALALNANGDPARFADLGLPVLPDPVPGQPGPLAGVLAGLDWAAGLRLDWLLTVPGDAPFLPDDLLERLHAVRSPAGLACASSGGQVHPVSALWPVGGRGALRTALAAGMHKVRAFTGPVPTATWSTRPVDPFANLNSPADLPDQAEGTAGATGIRSRG